MHFYRFLSILDDKTETELWLCELKRIKVRKDFLSMKNYFDKSLFETFGDSVEDSTSLEMIDAWIQARCDPEALEKVFEENFKVDSSSDSSTVQIYQSLLLECCDVLPEGKASNILPSILPQALFTRDILAHNIAIKRYCDKKIFLGHGSL